MVIPRFCLISGIMDGLEGDGLKERIRDKHVYALGIRSPQQTTEFRPPYLPRLINRANDKIKQRRMKNEIFLKHICS